MELASLIFLSREKYNSRRLSNRRTCSILIQRFRQVRAAQTTKRTGTEWNEAKREKKKKLHIGFERCIAYRDPRLVSKFRGWPLSARARVRECYHIR